MKVKDINLGTNIGKRIKIVKVKSIEDKFLEGRTGTLTNPFVCFSIKGVGIFLDEPIDTSLELKDICNLSKQDEIEFIGGGD